MPKLKNSNATFRLIFKQRGFELIIDFLLIFGAKIQDIEL